MEKNDSGGKKDRSRDSRRKVFAAEYQKTLNATEAAKAAGYSADSAHVTGSRLLNDAKVWQDIQQSTQARLQRVGVETEDIIGELKRIGFMNAGELLAIPPDGGTPYIDWNRLNADHAAAIAEIIEDSTGGGGDGERKQVKRVRLKLHNKLEALTLLARHKAILTDRIEAKVTGGEFIERLMSGRQRARKAGQERDAEIDAILGKCCPSCQEKIKQVKRSLKVWLSDREKEEIRAEVMKEMEGGNGSKRQCRESG